MAENIKKLYPGGLWYGDDLQKRYDHVCQKLYAWYKHEDDDDDLNWHIKNAVIGHIYVSQEVFNLFGDKQYGNSRVNDFWNEIKTSGKATAEYMDIRKWCTGKKIRFEHIVPAKVFLPTIKDLYQKNLLTQPTFKKIWDRLAVCLITEKQNKLLDDNHLRQSMPIRCPPIDWLNDSAGSELSRYEGYIQIYKPIT